MKYLSAADILLIHSIIIDESGGSHGIRDRGTLLSLEYLPRQEAFGKELYSDAFKKAALYVRNIICGHPFIIRPQSTPQLAAGMNCERIITQHLSQKVLGQLPRAQADEIPRQLAAR